MTPVELSDAVDHFSHALFNVLLPAVAYYFIAMLKQTITAWLALEARKGSVGAGSGPLGSREATKP